MDARPLAVVGAPRISHRVAADIAGYARRFAPESAWGLVDSAGAIELHGEGLDRVRGRAPGRAARRPRPPSERRADAFSDLGQWMLKVFLAPMLAPKHLAAPRIEIMNASQLAEVSGVSLPSAARLVAELRRLGFLADGAEGLRLVRVADLLQGWRAASAGRVDEIRARWLVPPKDGAAELGRVLAQSPPARGVPKAQAQAQRRACLALFAAYERLGFRFVRGAPLHIYLEDVSVESLERLGLAPSEAQERFDVVIRRPRFPEAVFRACVVREGTAASDLVQCWLDVSGHPARGQELADQIWRRVLAPRLLGEGSS